MRQLVNPYHEENLRRQRDQLQMMQQDVLRRQHYEALVNAYSEPIVDMAVGSGNGGSSSVTLTGMSITEIKPNKKLLLL